MKIGITLAIASGAILLGTGGMASAVLLNKAEGQDETDPKVVRPVAVAEVRHSPDSTTRIFPGLVQASQQVDLAFSVSGKIDNFPIREGMFIKKGEILGTLDKRDYENALRIARANHTEAKSSFSRKNALFTNSVIPESEYEHTRAVLEMSKGELEIREKALEDTVLVAPFDGIVAKQFAENHEHIQAGQDVLSFQDISTVEVRIQVAERIMASRRSAFLENITVKFDSDPMGRTFTGAKVSEFSIQADPVTGTYEVIVEIQAPEDFQLLPGMTATVTAEVPLLHASGSQVATDRSLTRIPVQAVVRDASGESYVWLADADLERAVRKVSVETMSLEDNDVLIQSTLKPGENIIISGLDRLYEDMRIRVLNTVN